jgi:NAD(P)-dependent dehydrogenase (short-subunit alcohol dehydrogenase family)
MENSKKISKKIAAVTGANRGIGLEVAKQLGAQGYHVILASRGKPPTLKDGDFEHLSLDVSDESSIREFFKTVCLRHGKLDVLVNNAGVFLDSNSDFKDGSAFEIPAETIRKTFATNALGPYLLCQLFIPLMKKQGYGRVVNISSGMGQLSEMNGNYPAYRISKTSLNAITRIFAAESLGTDVLVNSICPGWVKTDMGGAGAERSVEKGASGAVWAATLPSGGPTGGFFRDGEAIEW